MKYSSEPGTNRLRITRRDRVTSCDGAYNITQDNRLEYWLNNPPKWRRAHNLPSRISFEGAWRISGSDNLQLSVTKASYMPEAFSGISRITLNGRIIAAEGNALIFESRLIDNNGLLHARLLRLRGSWGTDDSNRITFCVTRSAALDTLTLSGTWTVNDRQHITYTVEKPSSAQKANKPLSSVEFGGFWKINSSKRISYIISETYNSVLEFKAQLETPNVYPQAGVIKYRLGAGMKTAATRRPSVICLYGQWKIGRKIGINFEMEYEKGKVRVIEFSGRLDVLRRDRLEFAFLTSVKRIWACGLYALTGL